jgi:hypothetical protein
MVSLYKTPGKSPGLQFFVLAFLLSAILAGAPLSAQETEAEIDTTPWNIYLYFRNESTSLSSSEAQFLYEALVINLREARENLTLVEANSSEEISWEQLSQLARSNGCEAWFSVNLSDFEDQLAIRYELFNTLSMETVFRDYFEAPKPGIRDLISLFWYSTASALLKLPLKEDYYTIHGEPGTRIYGLPGAKYYRLDNEGLYRTSFMLPRSALIRTEKLGYAPKEFQYFFTEKGGDLYLGQEKANRYYISLSLLNLHYPELNFGIGFIRDYLYLQLGLAYLHQREYYFFSGDDYDRGNRWEIVDLGGGYYYWQPIVPVNEHPSNKALQFSLELKLYFFQPDSFTRLYIASGISPRFWIDASPGFAGLLVRAPAFGIEALLFDRVSLFMEPSLVFYLKGARPLGVPTGYDDYNKIDWSYRFGLKFKVGDPKK